MKIIRIFLIIFYILPFNYSQADEIDKRNKIIDYKLFFEAIQKDLHSNNKTTFNDYYSIYDSLNIDLNDFSQEIGQMKTIEMSNYVNKVKKKRRVVRLFFFFYFIFMLRLEHVLLIYVIQSLLQSFLF